MPDGGFPKIERFSPYCLLGCLEAVCRAEHGLPDLTDCYYNHTFRYSREGRVRRRAGGLLLDLYFGCVMSDTRRKCFSRLRERHGIAVQRLDFASFDELQAYSRQRLEAGGCFVSYYDLFYLPGRREYHTVHQPHFVAVFGQDRANGTLSVAEQMLGLVELPFSDWFDCFHLAEPLEPSHVFECRRVDTPSPPSPLVDLRDELALFLDNLESPDVASGLGAFAAFVDDIECFLQEPGLAPFYVPGLWSFSHDRHHFRAALASFAERHDPRLRDDTLLEILARLQSLHELWLRIDYQIEASIKMQRASLVKSAYGQLAAVRDLEREMPPLLRRLQARCAELV